MVSPVPCLSLLFWPSIKRSTSQWTVQAYAAIVRAAITYCKGRQIVIAPSLLQKGNKCNGKTYPKGAFFGTEAFLGNGPLEMLARAFEKGAKATPSSWAFTFDSLL